MIERSSFGRCRYFATALIGWKAVERIRSNWLARKESSQSTSGQHETRIVHASRVSLHPAWVFSGRLTSCISPSSLEMAGSISTKCVQKTDAELTELVANHYRSAQVDCHRCEIAWTRTLARRRSIAMAPPNFLSSRSFGCKILVHVEGSFWNGPVGLQQDACSTITVQLIE